SRRMRSPGAQGQLAVQRRADQVIGSAIADLSAWLRTIEIDRLSPGTAEPCADELGGIHLVLARDLQTAGVALHLDGELSRRPPPIPLADDFDPVLPLNDSEMPVLIEEARTHPHADQSGVARTDPEPSSHLKQRVVRFAGTQEVGDHKPVEGES